MYLDIGNNLPALQALFASLESPDSEIWTVCGFSTSLEKDQIFKFMGSKASKIFCASSGHFKLTKAEDLHGEAKKYAGEKVVVEELVDDGAVAGTVKRTIALAGKRA